MGHEVNMRIARTVEVGSSDVVFKAYDDEGLIGTLSISRGGLEWRSAKHKYVTFTDWTRFDSIAGTFPHEERKPTPRTRRAAKGKPARKRKAARRRPAAKRRR